MRLNMRRRLSRPAWGPPLPGARIRGCLRQFAPGGSKSETVVNPEPGPRWFRGSLRQFALGGRNSETVVNLEPGPRWIGGGLRQFGPAGSKSEAVVNPGPGPAGGRLSGLT
eukprot:15436928-Alexandrium_andersonii.AAC.1